MYPEIHEVFLYKGGIMDRGTLTLRNKRRTLMTKIKNRCCYTVTLILCGTLFLTGLTGCKSTEAQFLIDGLQEAKAEVDAESSEEKTSGQKSKKDTDDRQNDDGSSAESRKKQAESDGSDAGNGTEINSAGETQPEMIYVDVCGAVANPGVFQLAAGSRVFQAIEAAGGYLPEAALTCVNRAGVLTDGQQLYILTQEEMERQGLDPAEMAGASDGQMNGSAGTGMICPFQAGYGIFLLLRYSVTGCGCWHRNFDSTVRSCHRRSSRCV